MVRLLLKALISMTFLFQVGCSFDMEIEDLVSIFDGDLEITKVGEKASYAPGDSVTITWDKKGDVGEYVDEVTIAYSVDGGDTWTEITDSAPNTGEYVWTAPDHESTECEIKITAVYNDQEISVKSSSFALDKTEPVVGADQNETTNEDTVLNFTLNLGTDNITDSEDLTVHLVTGPTMGTLTGCADGTAESVDCTYTPNADAYGADTFTYLVRDVAGHDAVVNANVNITVNPINDAPIATASCATAVTEDSAYTTCTPAHTDADPTDTHTWALDVTNTCAWASVNIFTGVVDGTPDNSHVGACTLAFKVNDGTVDSNILSFAVTVTNLAPTLTIADATAINEDSPAVLIRANADVAASDEGVGATAYSFDHAGTSGTKCNDNATSLSIVAATGEVTYQPAADYNGTCNILVSFDDGNGGIVSNEFSITVNPINDVPVISSTCPTSVLEDDPYVCAPAVVDPDTGDTQAWVFATGHTCSWMAINGSSGAISGTPGDPDVGTCVLRFKSNDGTADSNIESYTVTVTNVNDPPVASASCGTSGTEDSAYSCTPGVTDPDTMDTHTWSLDSSNDCGWAAVNSSTGEVTGTPDNGDVGACTLAFKANDGTVDSNVLSYSMTISNNAPSMTIADAANITEDAPATEIRADADVQADDEGQGTTTYSFDHATTTGTKCNDNAISLSIDSSTGAVTYQPAADYTGTCNIKVSFDDGNSGTVDDEFSITVDNVNDAPVITSTCSTAVNEDAAYTTCSPGVTDADSGDTQTWSLDASNDCSWASINSSSGAIDGTPDNSHVGTCTLAFKSNDGTIDSNIESYTVTVSNTAPTLTIADASSINEDASATEIRADGDVAASDEGQGSTTYSFDHATTSGTKCNDNAVSLTIDSSTGAVTYAPSADYNGTCNIKVSFDDGNGGTIDDEFSITVNAQNDAPIISSTCATTVAEDSAYSCTPGVTDVDSRSTSGPKKSVSCATACPFRQAERSRPATRLSSR